MTTIETKDGSKDVESCWEGHAFAVTPSQNVFYPDRWSITHILSGLRLPTWNMEREEAIAIAIKCDASKELRESIDINDEEAFYIALDRITEEGRYSTTGESDLADIDCPDCQDEGTWEAAYEAAESRWFENAYGSDHFTEAIAS